MADTARTNRVAELFGSVRATSERLCEPLELADYEAQSMADCSPVKWHLAHTTWFFETFVLERFEPDFKPFHPKFGFLFNSYYNAKGARHSRPTRSLLTRPSLKTVYDYRREITERVQGLLERAGVLSPDDRAEMGSLVELGAHHEQQHQELILTDVKHLFSKNALNPVYRSESALAVTDSSPLEFTTHSGGLCHVGHKGDTFAYDNEGPRHQVFLNPFAIAGRLITNGEFAEFVADGGYQRSDLWLDQGFRIFSEASTQAPLYWRGEQGSYGEFTLSGERELRQHEPVTHVSFYEADAFATWAGARLPREEEWELAAQRSLGSEPTLRGGNFVESDCFHPRAPRSDARNEAVRQQFFGDTWEWTRSAYSPYPGFVAPAGALGEYNGKFMCNQFVLRGGSCVTARSHIRNTYRNFFYGPDRWQFTGIRLAKDA